MKRESRGKGSSKIAQWYYKHSGFQIESELHLPEWSAFELPPSTRPDLRIFWSAQPASAPGLGTPPQSVTADEWCFFVPEAAEYRVRRAGEIEVCAVPDPDMTKVRVCLYGAAWAAFCYLREMLLLHASVIDIGGAAIAFCGPSGAGKSSLAARMTTLGYPLVSDDLCRIDLSSPGTPLVYPSATRLKLWREALPLLDITDVALEQDHARMDKFHVPLAGAFSPERLPLTAVFVLAWGEPACTRLTGTAGLRRLIGAATYRGDLLEATKGLAQHWASCAQLTRRVTVWELTRPRDWSRMESAVALVLDGCGKPKPVREPQSKSF